MKCTVWEKFIISNAIEPSYRPREFKSEDEALQYIQNENTTAFRITYDFKLKGSI